MRLWFVMLLAGFMLPAQAWTLGKLGEFRFEPVNDNVYVMHGPLGEPNPENHGFMNNPGIIVTGQGVIMIDPGSTREVGKQIIAELQKITEQPVVAVFNTHIHGDHWLANQAIKEAWPQAVIYAHPNMIARAGERGAFWVDLMERLTQGRSKGTVAQIPDLPTQNNDSLQIAGQTFRIHARVPAHTNTDIMIEHVESGTLFTGDNSFNSRIGRFDGTSNIFGTIEALQQALAVKAKVYVPGHGRSGPAGVAVKPFLDYLQTLAREVKAGYAQDLQDFEIKPMIMARFEPWHDWSGFEEQFGKHVNKMYLEIEERDL